MAARRAALSAALAIAAVGWPWVLPSSTHFYGVLSVAYALVALSLTVLSGWAGQISLCQAAFLGIGVFLSAPLLDAGLPLPLVLLVAGAAGAAVSLVVGIPSLRLRGVYLAVVTLAFGAAAEKYFFPLRGYEADPVPRPTILGMSTVSERNLYLVAVAVLGIALLVAGNLRRSDVGRSLFAIRDSEEAAMAMGIRIARYKVGAFAFSAALATIAGVLYAMLFLSTPSPAQFGVLQSLFLLALPVIGGLETLAGPIVGGVIMGTSQPLVDAFDLRLFLVSGLLLVAVTLARSDGLVGLVIRLWRSAREQLAPQTVPRYGSFLPEEAVGEQAGNSGAAPRVRLRVPALPAGARLRLRIGSAR